MHRVTSDADLRRKLEAPPGFEPGVEVLQTSALPLGDGASVGMELTRKCLTGRDFIDARLGGLLAKRYRRIALGCNVLGVAQGA